MRKLLTVLLCTTVFLAPSFAQTNYTRMLSGVNAQTGTSYTIQASDVTKLVTFNNSSAVAVTLPAGSLTGFGAGTIYSVRNLGAGTVTLTCACLIYSASGTGAATLALAQAQGADIYSDGTNFTAQAIGTGSGGASPVNGINAITFGVTANTQFRSDATTVNTSKIVTCPDCLFTSADVGKIVWVQNTFNINTSLILAQDTIATVNSATSITTTSNAATASQSGNAFIVWGTDDTTALAAAWTAAQANGNQCRSVILPMGQMLTQLPQFNSLAATCITSATLYNQPGIFGAGKNSTYIIPTPNFNFAGCNPACFLGYTPTIAKGFSFQGFGLNPAGGNGRTLAANAGGFVTDMDLAYWCLSCAGSIGLAVSGAGSGTNFGGSEAFGATGIFVTSAGAQFYNFISAYNPLEVAAHGVLSLGNYWNTILVDANSEISMNNDSVQGASIVVAGTGLVHASSTHFDSLGGTNITLNPGARMDAIDSFFKPNSGPSWLIEYDTGSFTDLGGNTYTGRVSSQYPFFLQNATAQVASQSTDAVTIPGTTAGSGLLVILTWTEAAGSPTLSTLADTLGNTFTQINTTQTSGNTFGALKFVGLWQIKKNIGSGSDTITATLSGVSARIALTAFEYKEQDQVTFLDANSGPTLASGTAVTSGALTTTNPSDSIVFIAGTNGSFSTFTSSGTPLFSRQNGTDNVEFDNGIYAGGTSYTISGSWGVNVDWVGWFLQLRSRAFNGVPTFKSQLSAGGTKQIPANIAYTSNWGTSPGAVTVTGNSDSNYEQFTLTTGTTAGANPVFTVTFPTAFQVTPICSARQVGGTQAVSTITTGVPTTTAVPFTWSGTPGNGNTLVIQVTCQ